MNQLILGLKIMGTLNVFLFIAMVILVVMYCNRGRKQGFKMEDVLSIIVLILGIGLSVAIALILAAWI